MENSNLPALNNNVSGTYGPQFFNPTEGLEVAYNVIEYYDKKSGADRTVLCRDVMINSDFIIAGSTLYRNRITAASPEVGIPLLKKFEYTIKDKREVHAGNYHTEWTCSTANEEKRNIIADYHTEKARVTILKENLLDMTSETIMPDVEDINRESEMWIVRTHSEAVALSKKGAQAWNKECKKAFKDQMSDPEFLRKYVLIMKRASLLTLRGDYRNKLDAAYSKKLFGLLAAKKTNTVEKTRKFTIKLKLSSLGTLKELKSTMNRF